jgi:hypothetical protein
MSELSLSLSRVERLRWHVEFFDCTREPPEEARSSEEWARVAMLGVNIEKF